MGSKFTGFERLEVLQVTGAFKGSLDKEVLPRGLKAVCILGDFNITLARVGWPPSLEELKIGSTLFDQPIDDAQWPPSLRRFSIGWEDPRIDPPIFNRPIDHVS